MKPVTLLRGLAAAVLATSAVAAWAQSGDAVVALPSAASAPAAVVDSARLFNDVRMLSAPEMEGRRTGSDGNRKAAAYIEQRFKEIGLRPLGATFAQPFTAGKIDGVNLVAVIPGSAGEAKLSKPYLLVSAHYDHLGIRNGKLYAGADDNASGVAALLAVAAWFKAHPPIHTVVLAAFDGEEVGLLGAKAFVSNMPFAKNQLALALNFDMVSRNEKNELYATGTLPNPALVPVVAAAAARHTVKVKLGHDVGKGEENWTHASDHGPFHDAGVPFLYFGVEDHPGYHQPGDTFDQITQPFFARVADLLIDVAATADRTLK